MTTKQQMSTRDLAFISVFVALIVALSQVSIPLPGGVPLTLQTFIVPLTGAILGPKKALMAIGAYILLGAIGLPVFSNFQGGLGRIFGPTGGFILSFPIVAVVVGLGAKTKKPVLFALALGLACAINLSFGMVQFAFVTDNSLQTAFSIAVAPFLLLEVFKMALVFLVTPIITRAMAQAKGQNN